MAIVVKHVAGGLPVQLLGRKGSRPDGMHLMGDSAVEALDMRALLRCVRINHLLEDAPFP